MFLESQNQNDRRGVIACFRNEPSMSRRVLSADYVRAQIVYRNSQGQEIGDGVSSACWLGHHFDTIDFQVGQSHCVLLGFLDDGRLLVPLKQREHHWDGDVINLADRTFDGKVSQIPLGVGRRFSGPVR